MGEFEPKPKKARGRPKGSKNTKKVVVVKNVKRKRLSPSTSLLPARVLPDADPYCYSSFADDPDITEWTENAVINQPFVSYSLISPENRIRQLSETCSSSTSIPMICESEPFLDNYSAGNNTMESTNESLPNNADVPSCIKLEMTDMETGFCYNEQFSTTSKVSPEFNKLAKKTSDVNVCFQKISESIKAEPHFPEEPPINSITSITHTIQSNKEGIYLNENVSCEGKRKRIKIEHMSPEHSSTHSIILFTQPNKNECSLNTNSSSEQIREEIKSEPNPSGRSSTPFTPAVTAIKSNENELKNLPNKTSHDQSNESHSTIAEIPIYPVSSKVNHGQSLDGCSEQTRHAKIKIESSSRDRDVTTCEYAEAIRHEGQYITDNSMKQLKIKVEGNIHSITEKKVLTTSISHSKESTYKSKSYCRSNFSSNQVSEEFHTDSAAYLMMKVNFTQGDILECLDFLSRKYPCQNSMELFYDDEIEHVDEPEPQVLDNNEKQTSFNSSVDVDIEKRIDAEYTTRCTLNQKLSLSPIYPKIKIEESSTANENYLNEGTALSDHKLHKTIDNASAARASTNITNKIQDLDSVNSPIIQSHNALTMQDSSEESSDMSSMNFTNDNNFERSTVWEKRDKDEHAFSCTSSEVMNMSEKYISYQNSKQSNVHKPSVAENLQRNFRKHVISPQSAQATSSYAGGGSIVCSKDLSRNIFPDRRGNEGMSTRGMYRNVGSQFISSNDMYFLITEWNSEWLHIQKDTNLCPPICEQYHEVKDTYESIEEHYNTFFPLHLLSIWLEMYESWNQDTSNSISVKFDSYEEKPHYVRNILSHYMPNDNILPCEGIYMVGSKADRNDDELFGYVHAIQTEKFPNSWKKATIFCYTAEKPNIGVNERILIQKLCNIRVSLIQNEALQALNASTRREIILNPKAYVARLQVIGLPPFRNVKSTHEGARRILEHSMSSDNNITIVDTPPRCDKWLTILKVIEGMVERRCTVLVCFKTKEKLFELARHLLIRSLILAIKKSEVEVPKEFQEYLLHARATELNITEEEVLRRCKIIFTVLSGIYLSNSGNVFKNSGLACIIDDANLCSETETLLPLSYNPKYVVLMGSSTTQAEMHPRLQAYGYQQSLYSRLYKASKNT